MEPHKESGGGIRVAKEGSERIVEALGELKVDQNRTNGGREDQHAREKEKRGFDLYRKEFRGKCVMRWDQTDFVLADTRSEEQEIRRAGRGIWILSIRRK